MSVDRTIEELSGTLAQLGKLVEHINAQIVGISSRVNVTLDNFDHAVAGIATDAGVMTGQVGDTVAQVPASWVFYLLFITLIIVLVLLSLLIALSLIAKAASILRIVKESSRPNTPLPSLVYSESKQPLNTGGGGGVLIGSGGSGSGPYAMSPQARERLRHIAVPMESEPKRYGTSAAGRNTLVHPANFGGGGDPSLHAQRVQQTGNTTAEPRHNEDALHRRRFLPPTDESGAQSPPSPYASPRPPHRPLTTPRGYHGDESSALPYPGTAAYFRSPGYASSTPETGSVRSLLSASAVVGGRSTTPGSFRNLQLFPEEFTEKRAAV